MSDIVYSSFVSDNDLKEILKLQRANLFSSLLPEEKSNQGYLTVEHSFDLLKEMWELEPGVTGKEEERLAAYVLAMTRSSFSSIPLLIPLFEIFDNILYKGESISSYNYIVVGQICVAKEFRGSGIFDQSYFAFRNLLKDKYDFAVTEIATKNLRSLHAHNRVGFKELDKYVSPTGEEWSVVIWEW